MCSPRQWQLTIWPSRSNSDATRARVRQRSMSSIRRSRCWRNCVSRACCPRPMSTGSRKRGRTRRSSGAACNDARDPAGFGVVKHLPARELPAQFAGREGKGGIFFRRVEQDRTGECSTGPNALADGGEQVALKIEEIANEIVGVGFDRELAAFQIGKASVDARREMGEGDTGGVDRRYLPSELCQVHGVAACPAREIERATWGK